MARGKLQRVSIFPDDLPGGQFGQNWRVMIEFAPDEEPVVGYTNSRIVLSVLNTALLRASKWDVEISLADNTRTITRVRVYDDRENICTGGGLEKRPDGKPVRPLTPTAFADEMPRKWGFIFADAAKCLEYKGTSLDVYRAVEDAWLQERTVVLTFDANDKNDHIIAAQLYVGD